MNTYRQIKDLLLSSGEMSEGEASAVALMLLEDMGGLSKVDVLMGREPDNTDSILAVAKRVSEGEPVQYALGKAEFCGLTFRVGQGVLIPRAETAELVEWAVSTGAKRVLDIGTGSGCIAVTLAKRMGGASVTAIDMSDEALSIARANATDNEADVKFVRMDILQEELRGSYDLIVSNPPYICHSEAEDMESNVLNHEPHLALFVPDDDPLLFYRRIALLAQSSLQAGGALMFEINRRFGQHTADMLRQMGFEDVEVRKDQFGNDRMVKAIKV